MTKYIISSGISVVSEILETGQITVIRVTNEADKATSFDTIGEAMSKAAEVNKILGTHGYRAMSIEV